MKPLAIRIELLKNGYTNRSVADMLMLSPRTVHNVIYGHGKSRRVAQKISELTGISISRLWPGKYPATPSAARRAA